MPSNRTVAGDTTLTGASPEYATHNIEVGQTLPTSPESEAALRSAFEKQAAASNPTLPEAVREQAVDAIQGLDWAVSDVLDIIDAIAPLIIEWARKDQAEVDARLGDSIKGSHFPYSMGWASAERVAAAIRAQFTGETIGASDDHQ